MDDAGSSNNALHNLDGNVCIRLEPKANVYYRSFWKGKVVYVAFNSFGKIFHSFACKNHRIILLPTLICAVLRGVN